VREALWRGRAAFGRSGSTADARSGSSLTSIGSSAAMGLPPVDRAALALAAAAYRAAGVPDAGAALRWNAGPEEGPPTGPRS
jgi:hypothetical protein